MRIRTILALIAILSSPAMAAMSLIQHQTNFCNVETLTMTPTGSGNVLVVMLGGYGPGYPAAPTDNATLGSNTYTEVTGCRQSGAAFTTCFVSCNSNSGAALLSFAGTYGAAFFEYSGNATSNCVDISTGIAGTQNASGVAIVSSMTITNAGDALMAYHAPNDSSVSVATPWGDWKGDNCVIGSADYLPGATGSYAATFTGTIGGDPFSYAAIAILPASGGGGTPTNPRRVIITQ